MGAHAHASLRDAARSWHVLASFSEAAYLESDVGDIVWIAAQPAALHARAVLIPSMPAESLPTGLPCRVEGEYLYLGHRFAVHLGDADCWLPKLPMQCGEDLAGAAHRVLRAILGAATVSRPRGALANHLFQRESSSRQDQHGFLDQTVVTTCLHALCCLCRVGGDEGLQRYRQETLAAVGLGSGLTPSGDDVLGAFLYVRNALDPKHSAHKDDQSLQLWLDEAQERTNRISFTILKDHALGWAAEPLHEMVGNALNGDRLSDLVEAAVRVSAIGHSSGWDMLAGVFFACGAVLGMAPGALRDFAHKAILECLMR
jgi:hypothetical protein